MRSSYLFTDCGALRIFATVMFVFKSHDSSRTRDTPEYPETRQSTRSLQSTQSLQSTRSLQSTQSLQSTRHSRANGLALLQGINICGAGSSLQFLHQRTITSLAQELTNQQLRPRAERTIGKQVSTWKLDLETSPTSSHRRRHKITPPPCR